MSSTPLPFVLREYALLADGERGALIDPHGNVAWMCAPRWHDPAIFSSMLGGRSGYAITPAERFVWGGYYEDGTLIWRSRWVTSTGTIECREALALPARPEGFVLLRRLEAIDGPARVDVTMRMRSDYDRDAVSLRRNEDGTWRGRAGELRVVLAGLSEAKARDGLRAHIELEQGAHRDLVLAVGDDQPDLNAEECWQATEAAWRERVPHLSHTLAPRDARHAVAVLQGLTCAGGGMVAAATMALPERAREGRNYDYRYAWIRDQSYAGCAAAMAGVPSLLDAALNYARDRLLADGDSLMPAYTIAGDRVPDEHHAGLPGYPGGGDVVGNWVNSQFQLDAFGELLRLFAAGREQDRLDSEHWRAAEVAAAAIEKRWTEADAGIWEINPRRWVHSQLICVAGLRRLAHSAGPSPSAARWEALADAILAHCSEHNLHPTGRWQRSPDDERVDAALLLGALRGAVPPEDPRSQQTLRAVIEELGEDHMAFRFRPDGRPLGQAEGAFLLCGMWVALALHQQGRREDALRWFERGRSACGTPGLFSEEYDVRERQLRGNIPQAFVHALLLEAAVSLADED